MPIGESTHPISHSEMYLISKTILCLQPTEIQDYPWESTKTEGKQGNSSSSYLHFCYMSDFSRLLALHCLRCCALAPTIKKTNV